MKIVAEVPRKKRRAKELYDNDSPFKPKVVMTKREKQLHKKPKHPTRWEDEE